MTKKRFKISDADVTYISLCPSGKNRIATLYKEEDGTIEFQTLIKEGGLTDKGELTAIVYAPGLPDADGHVADKEGIAQMCKSFMRNGAQVDIRHNQKVLSKEDIYVTECFLSKASDPEFAGTKDKLGRELDMDGAWITRYQIDSEVLRKSYRDGDWDGVSLFGKASLEALSKEDGTSVDHFLSALADRLRSPQQPEDEIEMNAELKKAMEDQTAAIVKGVGEAVATALKDPENKEGEGDDKKVVAKSTDPQPLEFKGSRTDPKDIANHVQRLKMAGLQKSVDWEDPASIEKYQAELAKMNSEEEGGDDDEEKFSDDPAKAKLEKEVRDLNKKIQRIDKQSTQGNGGGKGDKKKSNLTKEQSECVDAADRMAAANNGSPNS